MIPAEFDLQDKIGAAEKLVGLHVAREEFPAAALAKKSRDLLRQQLQLLKSQSSVKPPRVIGRPTKRQAPWAQPNRSPYKTWAELSTTGRAQTTWWIPHNPDSTFDKIMT